MKETPEYLITMANEVADFEEKLQALEVEIETIGFPAAGDLEKRLEALKVEEHALNRNLEEALGKGDPDPQKMEKAKALLNYIQSEEDAIKQEADFLNQANPSSAEVAAKTAKRLAELCHHAFSRVLGKHRPLGKSVFVNHSEKNLEEFYAMKKPKSED